MQRSTRRRVLAAVLTAGLVVGGSAAALANSATGHAFHTHVGINGHKKVAAGGDVKLHGTLSSGRNRCKSGQSIEIDRDGVAVGTVTTTDTGHYTFVDSGLAAGTYTYQAKFAGSTFGSTGQNTCKPSQSHDRTVTVES